MVVFRISVALFGDNLDVDLLLARLQGPLYPVVDVIRPQQLNHQGQPLGFGSIAIEHPRQYGFGHNLQEYQQWFVELLETHHLLWAQAQVQDIHLEVSVYYVTMCSIALFDQELLSRLSKFNVAIPMDVYQMPKQEMYEMLHNQGFDDASMWDLLHG